ncbi:hypothetical protein HK405_015194 [Cladochytrium tenue]|nr:hypothetical protein HK405_015194 [Cladochytrium tenue]
MHSTVSNQPLTSRQRQASSLFGLPLTREVPHPSLPGVTTGAPHPARPLLEHLWRALRAAGAGAAAAGAPAGPGDLVIRAANASATASSAARVDAVVRAVVANLPAFRDAAVVAGHEVWLLRGAQKLALNLHEGYAASNPALALLAQPPSEPPTADEDQPPAPLTALVDGTWVWRALAARGVLAGPAARGDADAVAAAAATPAAATVALRAASVVACGLAARAARAAGLADADDVAISALLWVEARATAGLARADASSQDDAER